MEAAEMSMKGNIFSAGDQEKSLSVFVVFEIANRLNE